MLRLLGTTQTHFMPDVGTGGPVPGQTVTPPPAADPAALARDVEILKREQALAAREAELKQQFDEIERGKAGITGVQQMIEGLRSGDPQAFVMLAEASTGSSNREELLAAAERLYDAWHGTAPTPQPDTKPNPASGGQPHPVQTDPDLLTLKRVNKLLGERGLSLEQALAIALGTSNQIATEKTVANIGSLADNDPILRAIFRNDPKLRGEFIQTVSGDIARSTEQGIDYNRALRDAFEGRAALVRKTVDAVANSFPTTSPGSPSNFLLGINPKKVEEPKFDDSMVTDLEKREAFCNQVASYVRSQSKAREQAWGN